MKRFILLFLMITLPLWASPIRVVATIPDLGWAAQEIGGEHVTVKNLLTGFEDPHYVDSNPKYIRALVKAEMLVFAGLDLEVGWIPKIIEQSGNPRIQLGGKGFCPVGPHIKDPLGVPQGVIDRSLGDVHPLGNPHFWISPKRLAEGAVVIANTMMAIRPELALDFEKNLAQFQKKLMTMHATNKAVLANAMAQSKNPTYIEYHQEFIYWAADHGIASFGTIEEKPGILPSAGRLARISLKAKEAKVPVAIATPYSPRKMLKRFESFSGLPVHVIPSSMQKGTPYDNYEAIQNRLVEVMVNGFTND